MGARILSYLRPTPSMFIAIFSLVIATAGGAVAAKQMVDRDEVTVTTFTQTVSVTGSADPENPSETQLVFPSFTQQANEAAEVIAALQSVQRPADAPTSSCDIFVEEAGAHIRISDLWERGPSPIRGILAWPVPDTAQTIAPTFNASAVQYTGPDTPLSCDATDTFQVTVRISVVLLRN